MRVLEAIAAPIVLDADGISLTQTPTGVSAVVTLDGVSAAVYPYAIQSGGSLAGGAVTGTRTEARLSPPRPVSITSGGDISNRTFTVLGYDRAGNVITETITGPNNTTVSGTKLFARIYSIVASNTAAAAITIGWTAVSYSRWIFLGADQINYSHMIRVFLSGTATYDLEATSMNMNRLALHGQGSTSDAPTYLGGDQPDDVITLESAKTAALDLPMLVPYVAIRIKATAQNANVTLRVNKSITG